MFVAQDICCHMTLLTAQCMLTSAVLVDTPCMIKKMDNVSSLLEYHLSHRVLTVLKALDHEG